MFLKYFKPIIILPILIVLGACEGKYNPREHDSVELSMDSLQRVKVSQDNTEIEMAPGAYTYIVDPHDVTVPVIEADSINEPQVKTSFQEEKLAPVEIIVSSPRVDLMENRPPIFSKSCLEEEYPVKCSSDKVAEFIRDHLEFPEEAVSAGHEGKQMVSLHVNKDGSVEDIRVETIGNGCKSCQTAAYSVVAAMPEDWAPAMDDGSPVGATIMIPIEFRTIE